MAGAKKTGKAPVKPATADSATTLLVPPAMLLLKSFFDGAGEFENFSFGRFYWETGEGERESIAARIDKKLHPVRSVKGEILASAAKFELIVPLDAPQEYLGLDYLVRRYEETLPAHEINAFAQVTIRFPNAVNLIEPFEMVRAWVRSHFAQVPVLLVLHAPHMWGSPNPGHCHCIVFPRRLSSLSWAEMERAIASDVGQREAYDSWIAFQKRWLEARTLAA